MPICLRVKYPLFLSDCNKISTDFPEILKYQISSKRQLDATEVLIADLIACSTCFGHHYAHHQELKSIIR